MRGEYIRAEDLPYGPGNPDYEYDSDRQRRDDEEREQQEQLSQQDQQENRNATQDLESV